MATRTILLVDDEPGIVAIARDYLDRAGFRVVTAGDGPNALRLARSERPSLLVLDLMLPGMDGLDVTRALRGDPATRTLPIIMLTARVDETDRLIGLELGADDYITKPFGTSELLARIRTSLRHSNRMASNSPLYIRPYKCQGLILDFEKRMLTLDGEEIHLTPVEYKIVAYLARNSGKVMTYASVMENVWGPFTDSNNRILRVNMANIRRKIERNPSQPQFLFTEVGVGYRMCEDENEI